MKKKSFQILFSVSVILLFILLINVCSAATNPSVGKVKIMFISDLSLNLNDQSSYVYWFMYNLTNSGMYNVSNIETRLESHTGWSTHDFINQLAPNGAIYNSIEQFKPDIVFINLGSYELYNNRYDNYYTSSIATRIFNITDMIRSQSPYTVFFISKSIFYDKDVNTRGYPNINQFNSALEEKKNNKSTWYSNIYLVDSYLINYYYYYNYYNYYTYYNQENARFMGSSMFSSIRSYWNTCTDLADYSNTGYDFCKSSFWCGKANNTLLKPNIIVSQNISNAITSGNKFLCAEDKKIYRCGDQQGLLTAIISVITSQVYNVYELDTEYLDTFSTSVASNTKKGFYTCSNEVWQYCNNNNVCETNLGESISSCSNDCHLPTCQFNYTAWERCMPCTTGNCLGNGTQNRSILNIFPSNCNGGTPESLIRNCTYVAPEVVPNYFCWPDSIVSCDNLNYGYYIGFKNKCNQNGTAYLNISSCEPRCNTGYRLSGNVCIPLPINGTIITNQTNYTINNSINDSYYPIVNDSINNEIKNDSNYTSNNDYSDKLNDKDIDSILDISADNSSSFSGDKQNSFLEDNKMPIIVIILLVIFAIILFLWIYFKYLPNKDEDKSITPNPVNQNNNFKPRPPMNPRIIQPQRINNRMPLRPMNYRPMQRI